MTKTIILELNISRNCGPRPDHPIPGTIQLAEEDSQYYFRWLPHEGPEITRTWEPISSIEAQVLKRDHQILRGVAAARRLELLNAPHR